LLSRHSHPSCLDTVSSFSLWGGTITTLGWSSSPDDLWVAHQESRRFTLGLGSEDTPKAKFLQLRSLTEGLAPMEIGLKVDMPR
jgi:hypothetical protein